MRDLEKIIMKFEEIVSPVFCNALAKHVGLIKRSTSKTLGHELDSTKVQLHEKLSAHFRGCGGVASKAELKINFIFEYLSEQFLDLHFVSGTISDQALSSRVFSILKAGDLLIRDLGYYTLARIKEIEAGSAFYISRFKIDELVFDTADAEEPVDLCEIIKKHINKGMFDFVVYLGRMKHPIRLIGIK